MPAITTSAPPPAMNKALETSSTGGAAKPLINLLLGWPNPALLPRNLIQQAANNVLAAPSVAVPAMSYGPDPGDLNLRENVASWLTSFYKARPAIPTSRITITGGASQNLGCVLQVYSDPVFTRNVWFVAPAYHLAFRIFDDNGLANKLRAVPEDDEGIDIGFLQREISKSEQKAEAEGNDQPKFKPRRPWGKIYKHIIYAVPTFSNPSFKTMTLRRREELVRLARKYDALIITDDVYDFLQWPREPSKSHGASALTTAVLPRIVDVDKTLDGGAARDAADGFGNAASNASFSKICGPGVRTGWVEGTDKFAHGVSQVGTSRSGGAPSHLTATLLADTLASGALQRHVFSTLQPTYARRYRRMLAALEQHLLPLGAQLPQTDREVVGGYFIWVTLPAAVDSSALARRVKDEENLVVAPGAQFEVPGDNADVTFSHQVRLCFAWEDEDKLAEGVERLAAAVKRMMGGQERGS